MKIKKGDTVQVMRGDDRGMRGTVHRVIPGKKKGSGKNPEGSRDPNNDRVVVSGVNIVKKHQRPTGRTRTQVGIIEREAPIHISNVALVCGHCRQPTRVGYRLFEGGKVRVCKRCGEPID
ncbi:MAG: 50S ribosomal protein L24 [Anaerolineae bacterium]